MPTSVGIDCLIAELIRDYGPAIPWLLVIWGWRVNNRQANEREKRKELRAEIDRIDDLIKEIISAHRNYRTNPPGSPADSEALSIKIGITRLAQALNRITLQLAGLNLQRQQTELFERLTGGDFETANRQPKRHGDQMMQAADIAAADLIDAIERAFLNR